MSSASSRIGIVALSVSLLSAQALAIPAFAAAAASDSPATNMLLQLEDRMDDSSNGAPSLAPVVKEAPPAPKRSVPSAAPAVHSVPQAPAQTAAQPAPKRAARPVRGKDGKIIKEEPAAKPEPKPLATDPTDVNSLVPSLAPIDDVKLGAAGATAGGEQPIGGEAIDPIIDENSLLKGTVQIVADDTEYDQEKNTFLGTGNAIAIIAGQNSKLEADTILYDQTTQMIDARGNVKIIRDGQLTTGSSFKFKLDSDEYMITNPDTELQGTQVIARTATGTKDGLLFKDGTLSMPQVIHIGNSGNAGPISQQERNFESKQHPDAYVPARQSFTFSARKMVYEKYKEDGNLTVFGGKMKFDHFTVPLPKFTATAGGDSRVVFPVTPFVSNNLNVGGVNLGPMFNYNVGKTGVFSVAPLVQLGGRSIYDTTTTQTNTGKLGAGARIQYAGAKASAHLAYGSVSNLVVADYKYRFNKKTIFQSGINRFLNDGIMGNRRARMAAELVDSRTITKVPYISMIQFRSSGGWYQDQPQLVSLQGSQYSDLFNTQGHTEKKSGFRLQEQISIVTHPILSVGNEKYGAKLMGYAGAALRGYSTGDSMAMGQFGPILTLRANRVRVQTGYTQSGVSGQSPFVFDQFIQGSRSVFLSGDVKVSNWLTLGTNLGYNMTNQLLYSRGISAAIGPDDVKLLVSRDTISGINRVGFDLVYGSPMQYKKMLLKGTPDAGQLGGI